MPNLVKKETFTRILMSASPEIRTYDGKQQYYSLEWRSLAGQSIEALRAKGWDVAAEAVGRMRDLGLSISPDRSFGGGSFVWLPRFVPQAKSLLLAEIDGRPFPEAVQIASSVIDFLGGAGVQFGCRIQEFRVVRAEGGDATADVQGVVLVGDANLLADGSRGLVVRRKPLGETKLRIP